MADETLEDITTELSALTLEAISQIEPWLTEDGTIPKALILGFNSDDLQIRRAALATIRQIQATQAIIDAGLVPTLVSMLDSEDTPLKCEAAWTVLDIAAGTSEQTARVVDAGAIPKLVTLSESPSEDVAENAVWALGNIAGDSPSFRDRVAAEGGIDAFMRLLNHSETTPRRVQRRAMWAVFCYLIPWSESNSLAVREVKHIVSLLARYIQEAPVDEAADNESITYAIQSLTRMLNLGFPRSDVIETGVVPRLVHLLADSSSGPALQTEVLQCIGFLIAGDDDDDADAIIEAGLLPALLVHLEAKDEDLCRWALWTASNIAAGNRSQARALVDYGLLKPAARILADDQSPLDCRREACWTISNLSDHLYGDVKVVQAFIDEGCGEAFSAALQIPDAKIREVAIEAITNVLEYQDSQGLQVRGSLLAIIQSSSVSQSLRNIRDSRTSENAALRKGCHALLTQYFPKYSKRARV